MLITARTWTLAIHWERALARLTQLQIEHQGEILSGEEICNDPGNCPAVINPGLKNTLVQRGPHQPKGIIFPNVIGNRRFTEARYITGEKLDRDHGS